VEQAPVPAIAAEAGPALRLWLPISDFGLMLILNLGWT